MDLMSRTEGLIAVCGKAEPQIRQYCRSNDAAEMEDIDFANEKVVISRRWEQSM